MESKGMVGGVLFLIGIAAIFISGGNTMYMIVGDALIAAAGLSMIFLGAKQPAKAAA
jgi:NADH:ubiquinone oxidoreductase subunit K